MTSYMLPRCFNLFKDKSSLLGSLKCYFRTKRNSHVVVKTIIPCSSCMVSHPYHVEQRFYLAKKFSSKNVKGKSANLNEVESKAQSRISLFQKFKTMYTKYWYVLIPVHIVTSSFWVGLFYTCAKSGLDIIPLLESFGVSETLVDPLRKTGAGYLAVTLGLYKLATPLRYAVTLGGTTISIKFLSSRGYIKPVPSKQEMKKIYDKGKEQFQDIKNDFKDKLREDYNDYKKKKKF